MKQKKTTGAQKTDYAPDACALPPSIHAQQDQTPSFESLDFLCDDFNRTDDLDDNIGNYREFESLEGVVTSDMRYHEKRTEKRRTNTDPTANKTAPPTKASSNREEKEQYPPQPLTIISEGRLLIIDPELGRALDYAKELRDRGMHCTLCVPGNNGGNGVTHSMVDAFPLIEAGSVVVDGSFGGFSLMLAEADGRKAEAPSATGQLPGFFDLVLDLQPTPSYAGTLLPVGYYVPGQTSAQIRETLEELAGMRGRFMKPQLTVLKRNRCLRGRSRYHDCRRCLEICPFNAVGTSAKRRETTLDQYRCQGCGWCAMVCPAEAIELQNPRREELLAELTDHLRNWQDAGNQAPELFFHDRQIDSGELRRRVAGQAAPPLLVEVEDIGRMGLEALLLALVHGAVTVSLVYDQTLPEKMREALEHQVQLGKEILEGLQLPGESIGMLQYSHEPTEPDICDVRQVSAPAAQITARTTPATVSPEAVDRRHLIREAAQYLNITSGANQQSVALSVGAPFGTITIDASCSFCMACVGACPSAALTTSGEVPRLSIVESRCHQCSFCSAVCPEVAIEMQPRLLLDRQAAETPTVLREEEPFTCIECGQPFASKKMISRMQEKLSGHWMYSTPGQIRRLRMCRTCRTRDALSAGDYRA